MKKIIAIDFDGVIHKYSDGWGDGTIYDPPVEGVDIALKTLTSKYTIIIYSCRALKSNKNGIDQMWEWLKKYNLDKYISSITATKPAAVAYVDDRAVHFENWITALKSIEKVAMKK